MVIYLITNLINDKKYIGCTSKDVPEYRWTEHKLSAKNNSSNIIHCAIRKYKPEKFTFEIIEYCETLDEMYESEIEWISHYDTFLGEGYNMTAGGDCGAIKFGEDNGFYGKKHSKETKQKMSEAQKGKIISEETREKIRQSTLGRKHSAESIRKMSASKIGMTHTDETKLKISENKLEYYKTHESHMKGKSLSEETKQKISEANTGKKHSNEVKEATSNRMMGNTYSKGIKHTDEAKHNMSEAQKGRKHSEETKLKMSKSGGCPILQLTITGVLVKEYHAISLAERELGVPKASIWSAVNKKSGLNLAFGYLWRKRSDFTEEQYQQMISEIS